MFGGMPRELEKIAAWRTAMDDLKLGVNSDGEQPTKRKTQEEIKKEKAEKAAKEAAAKERAEGHGPGGKPK